MTTYQFRTFQELVDRVPSDRIAECLRECGLAFAQGKAVAELVFHTACSLAKDTGKDAPAMPKHLLEVPDELEWIDDGKGEIKTTLSLPDNKAIICKSNTTPERLDSERNAARADVALITAENERLATGNHSMEKEIPELRHALEKAFAERDEHIARNNDSLLALHLTTAERDEARADVAQLRAALEGIAEYGKLCNDGDATDCARLIYLAKQALNAK